MHLKITEELKCRKRGRGTSELESDLFIVSLKRERENERDGSKTAARSELRELVNLIFFFFSTAVIKVSSPCLVLL